MEDNSLRTITFSSRHSVGLLDTPILDIDRDEAFIDLFNQCREYSMTSKPAMYALFQAVRYICQRGIPGAIVECGVWRGGSSLLAALTCRYFGDETRDFYLYDTFEGMPPASELDIDIDSNLGNDLIEKHGDDGKWCYVGLDEVIDTFARAGVALNHCHFIKGDVAETIVADSPGQIALLRLDTDWHDSTKLELELLYPRLQVGGVLIVDDYGHWSGARKAVDDYFAESPQLLSRIDAGVRLSVKW